MDIKKIIAGVQGITSQGAKSEVDAHQKIRADKALAEGAEEFQTAVYGGLAPYNGIGKKTFGTQAPSNLVEQSNESKLIGKAIARSKQMQGADDSFYQGEYGMKKMDYEDALSAITTNDIKADAQALGSDTKALREEAEQTLQGLQAQLNDADAMNENVKSRIERLKAIDEVSAQYLPYIKEEITRNPRNKEAGKAIVGDAKAVSTYLASLPDEELVQLVDKAVLMSEIQPRIESLKVRAKQIANEELAKANAFTGGFSQTMGGMGGMDATVKSIEADKWNRVAQDLEDLYTSVEDDDFASGWDEVMNIANIATFGMAELGGQGAMLSALRKAEQGQALTEAEQFLVEAAEIQQTLNAVREERGGASFWNNLGSGAAHSAEFIMQAAATGGVGTSTQGFKAASKLGTMQGAKYLLTKGIPKTLAKSAFRTTPLMASTYSNAVNRQIDQYAVDNGVVSLTNPESMLKSFIIAWADQTFEAASEMWGNYLHLGFGKIGKAFSLDKLTRKALPKKVGDKIVLRTTPSFRKVMRNTFGWSGDILSEVTSEFLGDVATNFAYKAINEDEQYWDQLFTQDYWLNLFTLTGMLKAGVTVASLPSVVANNKAANALDKRATASFNAIKSEELKNKVANLGGRKDIEDASEYLSSVDWKNYDKMDVANAMDYMMAEVERQIYVGSEVEQERAERYAPRLERIQELAYRNAEGVAMLTMVTAEANFGVDNTQGVTILGGDYNNPEAMVRVRLADGTTDVVLGEKLSNVQETDMSALVAEDYAMTFAEEDAMETLGEVEQTLSDMQRTGASNTQQIRAVEKAGLTVFNEGEVVTLLNGEEATVVEGFRHGLYTVMRADGSLSMVGVGGILQPDVAIAQAQRSAAMPQEQTPLTQSAPLPEGIDTTTDYATPDGFVGKAVDYNAESDQVTLQSADGGLTNVPRASLTVANAEQVAPQEDATENLATETISEMEQGEAEEAPLPVAPQTAPIPQNEDGSVDYESMTDATMYANALESDMGNVADAQEAVADVRQSKEAELAKLQEQKKQTANMNEKVALKQQEQKLVQQIAMLNEVENILANRNNAVEAETAQVNEAVETTLDNISYNLSDEIDENGRQFVLNSNGDTAFGWVDAESGLTPAPIMLSEGIITNPTTNDGYGLVHIEARHGKQIRENGYASVLDFIEEVAKNYEVIREGKNRNGEQTYLLQLTDKHNNTLMVELSGDGTYWNINTAGVFKTSYGRNNKVVYNRQTTAKQPAEAIETSQSVEQNGTQSPSSLIDAPTPNVPSENKDTNSVPNVQELEQKNNAITIAENAGVKENEYATQLRNENPAEYNTFNAIAKLLGIEIEFVESAGEGNALIVGNKMQVAYNPANREETLRFLIGHESLHRLKQVAPEAYAELMEYVKSYIGEELFGQRVERLRVRYEHQGIAITEESLEEEVVADFIGEMEEDYNVVSDLATQNPNKSWWQKLIEGLRNLFGFLEAAEADTAKVASILNKIETAYKTAAEKVQTLEVETVNGEVSAEINEAEGQARMSIRTYEEGGRAILVDFLQKQQAKDALTAEEADDILAQMDNLYTICKDYKDKYAPFGAWSEAAVVVGDDGKPVFSVIKKNGEYAMNLDFSLVCKKRRTLDAVLNEMVKRGLIEGISVSETTIAKINEVIRRYGFETACALCFVDARRFRVLKVAKDFADLYNSVVDKLIPKGSNIAVNEFNYGGREDVVEKENALDTMADESLNISALQKMSEGKSVKARIARHLLDNPQDRKYVTPSDFVSTAGFDNVAANNVPLLKLYNAKKGTGGPKAAFSDVQYLNDIAKKNWSVEDAFAVGGVRIQSFSDFVPRMVFDYMQMVAELAGKRLPAHAYTKEAIFAKMFGLTGIKINLSLVPDVVEGGVAAGLDANGDYVWRDGETFPYEEAVALQNAEGYKENCGTIAVGVSDEHILKMLDDSHIRMVIPYHKSGLNPLVAKMNNIGAYKDYTKEQSTRTAKGNSRTKEQKAQLPEPSFNELLRESNSPMEAAQKYLDWCKEHNLKPKFDRFASHPNYYKLLEDFTTYVDGAYVPQRSVTMTYPTAENAFGSISELIAQGLEEDAILEGQRDAKVAQMVDEIEGAKFSLRNPEWESQYGVSLADGKELSLEDVRTIFERTNKRKFYQKMFNKVYAVMEKLPRKVIKVVEELPDKRDVLGTASTKGDVTYLTVLFKDYGEQAIAEVLLHELIHSVTTYATHAYAYQAKGDNYAKAYDALPAEIKKACRELQSVYNRLSKKNDLKGAYGIKNIHEMLAELSNPQFRTLVKEGGFWKVLLNALKRMLGFETQYNAELKELDNILSSFLENYNEEAYMDAVESIYQREIFPTTIEEVDAKEAYAYSDAMYSLREKDAKTLDMLNNGETIKVYRAMQVIDGKLYPPMSAKVDGKMREPIELGVWERAEERPDLADAKGYFKLDKGNKSSLKARYNPYIHTSLTPLNDQFSSAQDRPNLVTVEVEIPASELTSGYKAEKAKDAVGKLEWKAGVVQSQLSGTRTVILSRWDRPLRIVPDSEVAQRIVEMFGDKEVVMPSNVVTPSLRAELEKLGIPFKETDNQGKEVKYSVKDITEEEQNIIATAKANGTYLKAPNGADTNLTPEQWVRVRTKAFKKWFGDWELARLWKQVQNLTAIFVPSTNITIKEAEEIYNNIGIVENASDGRKVEFVHGTFGKIVRHKGYDTKQLIPLIAEVFQTSMPIGFEKEIAKDGHKDHSSNFVGYHHYLGQINSEEGMYYVRFTVQQIKTNPSKKKKEGFTPNQLHSTFVSDIEIYSTDNRVISGNSPATANDGAIKPDTKLETFLNNAKSAYENVSKIVDENGEPKVVYHQTNATVYINRETGQNWDELDWRERMEWDERDDWDEYWEEQDFNTFSRVNARTTNEFDGFFFAPEYDEYHEYGNRTIRAFLDIRKPASREDYNIDASKNDAGRDERIRLQSEGYDGVIREEDGTIWEYIAFEPNQIKSADVVTYDDAGNVIPLSERFNPEKEDIRYSLRDDVRNILDAYDLGDDYRNYGTIQDVADRIEEVVDDYDGEEDITQLRDILNAFRYDQEDASNWGYRMDSGGEEDFENALRLYASQPSYSLREATGEEVKEYLADALRAAYADRLEQIDKRYNYIADTAKKGRRPFIIGDMDAALALVAPDGKKGLPLELQIAYDIANGLKFRWADSEGGIYKGLQEAIGDRKSVAGILDAQEGAYLNEYATRLAEQVGMSAEDVQEVVVNVVRNNPSRKDAIKTLGKNIPFEYNERVEQVIEDSRARAKGKASAEFEAALNSPDGNTPYARLMQDEVVEIVRASDVLRDMRAGIRGLRKRHAESKYEQAVRIETMRKRITDMVGTYFGRNMNAAEIKTLVNLISKAHTPEALERALDMIQRQEFNVQYRMQRQRKGRLLQNRISFAFTGNEMSVEQYLRQEGVDDATIKRLLSNRFKGVDAKGISVAKFVSAEVAKLMELVNNNINLTKNIEEQYSDFVNALNEAMQKVPAALLNNETLRSAIEALPTIMRMYWQVDEMVNSAKTYEEDLKELDEKIAEAEEAITFRPENMSDEAYEERVEQFSQVYKELIQLRDALMRQHLADMPSIVQLMAEANNAIEQMLLGGKQLLSEERKSLEEHKRDVLRDVEQDITNYGMDYAYLAEGVARPKSADDRAKKEQKKRGVIRNIWSETLDSLDQMLRKMGEDSANGMGRTYTRIMGGMMNAYNLMRGNIAEIDGTINARLKALWGGKRGYRNLQELIYTSQKIVVGSWTYGRVENRPQIVTTMGKQSTEYAEVTQTQEAELTMGQALYVLSAWNQADGRMKLERNGINEHTINDIKRKIADVDARWLDMMDFVIEELLPSRRDYYDEVHRRVNGAYMARVENYFPIKISDKEVHQVKNLDDLSISEASIIPSAIINRTHNTMMIDLDVDFFKVLLENVTDMERWAAMVEIRQDMTTILSDKRIRNLMEQKYGENFHSNLERAMKVALGTYTSVVPTNAEKGLMRLSRLWAGSRIAGRISTAIKQLVGVGAYMAYATNPSYWKYIGQAAKNPIQTIKEALDMFPMLKQRWDSASLGNVLLQQFNHTVTAKNESKWARGGQMFDDFVNTLQRYGIMPNAAVDLFASAVMAKATYEYEVKRYLKQGFSQQTAEEKARMDAELSYNLTQQSAETMFIGSLQASQGIIARTMTTFMNNPIANVRLGIQGIADIERLIMWERVMHNERNRLAIAFRKQYIAEGMSEEEAGIRAEQKALTEVQKISKWGVGYRGVKKALWGFFLNGFTFALAGSIWALSKFWDDDEKRGEIVDECLLNGFTSSFQAIPLAKQGVELAFYGRTSFTPMLDDALRQIESMQTYIKEGENISLSTMYGLANCVFTLGTGIDLNTWINVVDGVVTMGKEGGVEAGIAKLINMPKSQVKLLIGDRREGESAKEYMTRVMRTMAIIDKNKIDVAELENFNFETGKWEEEPNITEGQKRNVTKLYNQYQEAYLQDMLDSHPNEEVRTRYVNADTMHKALVESVFGSKNGNAKSAISSWINDNYGEHFTPLYSTNYPAYKALTRLDKLQEMLYDKQKQLEGLASQDGKAYYEALEERYNLLKEFEKTYSEYNNAIK